MPTIALEIQHAVELLLLIPGNSFSAALRRQAVDALLRIEGGDPGLIDRVLAQQRFQAYLTESCPDHPLLASIRDYIGEKTLKEEAAEGEETEEDLQETDSEHADASESATEEEKIEKEPQDCITTVQTEATSAPKGAEGQGREFQKRISVALAEKAEAKASMAKAMSEKTWADAEKAKADAVKAQAKAERAQAKVERAQNEANKAQIELEKAQIEANKAQIEFEKAQELKRTELEKAQIEFEKAQELKRTELEKAQTEAEKAKSDAHVEKLQKWALMQETLLRSRATTQLDVARALDGLGAPMSEEVQDMVSNAMLTSLVWPPCPDTTLGEGLALHDYLEFKMGRGPAAMRDVELDEFIVSKVKDHYPDLVIRKVCLFRNKRPVETDIMFQGLKSIMDQAFEEYMKKTTADKEKET
ncbi:hypothetical protein EBZ37_08145 [bacterium]|nr:hypothetical protein [bacterium]